MRLSGYTTLAGMVHLYLTLAGDLHRESDGQTYIPESHVGRHL
jgi:hypothetical protein